MKIVPFLMVLVVFWAGSSSSPVSCNDPNCASHPDHPDNHSTPLHRMERGFVSTVNNTARYVGKKLHIIKNREDTSVPEWSQKENSTRQVRKTDPDYNLPTEKPQETDLPTIINDVDPTEPATPLVLEETPMEKRSEAGNKTKRDNESDDPRYILVHDVPPCKKRRSIDEDDQPPTICNTQTGKNITIIIQNSMEGAKRSDEEGTAGNEKNCSEAGHKQHHALAKREAAVKNSTEAGHEKHRFKRAEPDQDLEKLDLENCTVPDGETSKFNHSNISKRAVVPSGLENPQPDPDVNGTGNDSSVGKAPIRDIMENETKPPQAPEAGSNGVGRKLLSQWEDDENLGGHLFVAMEERNQYEILYPDSVLHEGEKTVKNPPNYQQSSTPHPKQESDVGKEAESIAAHDFIHKLDGISELTSFVRCGCAVMKNTYNEECIHSISAGHFRDESDALDCTRACSILAEHFCHLDRAVPIKTTTDDSTDEDETRARLVDKAYHLEVAWLIILMLNMVVCLNTLVIGYMCLKERRKKKTGLFIVSDYHNNSHAME